MKRVKKVWASDMVFHLWANQSQEEAYSKTRHASFIGADAYSYRACIGRHLTHKKKKCVLLSCHRWSSTTNKHQCEIRNAVRGHPFPIFTVPVLHGCEQHKNNLEYYGKEISRLCGLAKRARNRKPYLVNEMHRMVVEANAYSQFFGFRKKFKPLTDEELAKLVEEAKKEVEKQKARDEIRKEQIEREMQKRQAEYLDALEKWKAGEDIELPTRYYPYDQNMSDILRIRGSRLESTRGAIVSIEEALKVLPLVRAGVEWLQHDPHCLQVSGGVIDMGGFPLREVTAEGDIRVGCHFIQRAEIERIAAILGK